MSTLRPFFTYYGGKWATAPRYPAPAYDRIVEPFAGSAGYSVRHHAREVVLWDLNERVIGTWQYLIRASAEEILSLPLLEPGQSVDDLSVCQEARWLVGWLISKGASFPRKTMSAWGREPRYVSQFWGEQIRARVASQFGFIKHWSAELVDYRDGGIVEATWFIDPPYQEMGRHYPCSTIDYAHLGEWCRSLPGQVIVCEGSDATWLPFEHFADVKSTSGRQKPSRVSRELIYVQDTCGNVTRQHH